jgi:malonyl-CoA O-methyltransferase
MDNQVASRFSEAASRYEEAARVQKQAAAEFDIWLAARGLPVPDRIAEIGCGTGFLTRQLSARFPDAAICATDLAPAMLDRCRKNLGSRTNIEYRLCDGRTVCFDPPPDWIVSTMCFQWFEPLEPVLRHHFAHCRTLAFSILLDGSFSEWRNAHAKAGLTAGLRDLPDYDQLLRTCASLHGARVNTHRISLHESHADGAEFVRALREIGAGEPRPGHRHVDIRPVLRTLKHGMQANYEIAFFCLEHED